MILLWIGIDPKYKADQEKLGIALQTLLAADPSLAVRTAGDGTVMLGTETDEQLEAAIDRLKREFNVSAAVSRPHIAYKERLTVSASGEAKYARQFGGRGQYAHVKLRVEPSAQGSGFVFENVIAGGAIRAEFAAPIEEGIAEALDSGVLAGYPIDDVRVTLYDGSYHDVDSSAAAFKIAGALAFLDAAKKARPVLLEPFMHVWINVPLELESQVNDALRARRGVVFFDNDGRQEDDGVVTITTLLPLSQLFGFRDDLRRRTQGRAVCEMRFAEYAPATPAADDGDRAADVTSPLRPRTPLRSLSASVPEPPPDLFE